MWYRDPLSGMRRLLLLLAIPSLAAAQSRRATPTTTPPRTAPDSATAARLVAGLKWRFIGPARGGRVTTVTGVLQEPHTFYMGTTGGGVWKTVDAGMTWSNVTDGFVDVGSIWHRSRRNRVIPMQPRPRR